MRRTLLIVDDIKSNREILKNILGSEYKIIEAEHGQEALAVMTAEYQHISVVLLDLGMPVMDGYEVLAYMLGSERLSQLPVIVTTGQTDSGSEERALKLGAKDYIAKPYKSAIIKQRIWNTINLRETAATVNALQRDRLTGLYSRDAFFERVGALVSEHEPGYYILACFDIDKFKVINDQYGTEKGDEVLQHIASVFRGGFEPVGGICCRIGADDFAVLYPVSFSESGEIDKLRRRAGTISGLASTLAFSIGRYVVEDITLPPSAMYDRAVLAADSVKGRYDDRIAVYDDSMRERLIHEQEIVTEMEVALARRQFEVWYQPQYNHSFGSLIGAEALVRWRHPVKGLIPPSVFVPVFEQNGFIYSLDKYVWEESCRFLRGELDAGRAPVPVSVNISRYDVFRADFVDFITGLIDKYGISVELLRLEITESAFAESTKHIVAVVKQLIDFGFTMEIDDFGSGYSSLNTLKSVPAQVVKLDMRFLEDDDDSQRGGNIIESVVRMTKWLGMSVIAEGVERKLQADYLLSIGCSYVQGYLYSAAMPEAAFRELCAGAGKEEKLLTMETVENLDNNSFWNPESMDTLIFNSYVGAACIFEYYDGKLDMLRATEKFGQLIAASGMTLDEALRLDWISCFDGESRSRVIADLEKSIETKKEITGEYILSALPGCSHDVSLRTTIRVIASAGKRYLVYCTNENVTAQRKAERRVREMSERLEAVMDNVACGITAGAIDGDTADFALANDRYYELLGYTRAQYGSEVNGLAFNTIYPEDRPRIREAAAQVLATGKPTTLEYRALRRDGSVIWLRSHESVVSFDGSDKRLLLSTYTDVTEQKKAELDLRNTTAQLRTMMDDIPGGFCRIRVYDDGRLTPVFINDGLCKLTGMTHDRIMEVYKKDALAGVHPDDIDAVRDVVALMLANGKAHSLRYRLLRNDGGYVWLSIFGRITNDSADGTYLNIYYMDASQQVRDEERQKELLDNMPYGVALYEYDGSSLSVIHLNKRYWELVDRSETEYEGESFKNAVYPDDRDIISRELESAIREQRDIMCDVRVLRGKSEYRPFHIVGRILKNSGGGYAIYAVYTPISNERMSVQEMLPIALSAVMDANTGYSFVKDRSLRYICCSRELAKAAGLGSADEIRGKSDYELLDKPLADAFTAADRRIMESGEPILDYIVRIPTKDGKDCYSNTSKFPLKDSMGNIVGIYGIGADVTEDRKMKTQFELLTNSIPGGIATYEYRDNKISVTYFSDGFCRLFELTREEYAAASAVNAFNGIFETDLPSVGRQVDALLNSGTQMDCIYRVHLKNGGYKWINMKASLSERDENRIVFNAVLFDVTQRHEAMERLRISEEENRLATQHTKNAICRFDTATRTLHIPATAQERFSLTETITDMPEGPIRSGVITPDTADAYREFYESIINGSETGMAVFQRRTRSGFIWLEAHFSTIFSDNGEPVSAVVSFTDITEQLEKDSAYKKWQQSFENKPPHSYSLFRCNVNKETSFDTSEGELLTIKFKQGPFSFDQHTAEYASQCVYEEDSERFATFLNVDSLLSGYYQGKRIVTLEYREKIPEGGYRWLRLTVDLVEPLHSSDIEAYLLFEDIDKAKRQELATIEQAETDPLTGVMNRLTFAARVNNIIETSKPGAQHAMMMLDMDGFKLVNDAFGHGAGDQALIDISDSLRTALRHGDLVGRLGGDEFLIFLTDIPGDVIASAKAKQICAMTRKSFSAEVELSGSIGIAVTPRDGSDFETLYKKVDAALYHVKGSGKNSFAFYHDDMSDEHLKPEERPAAAELTEHKKKRRMLIVDDSRIDHALLTSIFADKFIIEKAKDGNSALIRLRHYGSAISVVLLDLMMPGMDGFTVLKKMQESTELRNVPVIVVSGDDNRETSLRAIREGAVDFVNKPVDPDILRIRVQSAISKADNERLRAKNSFLEYQNSEIVRYRTALEHSGIVVIEHDWVAGTFIYDTLIGAHIAGKYDDRSLWQILLSDFVAETKTVKMIQELVHGIATDRKRSSEELVVKLKTPTGARHWFRMNVYKMMNEFGLAGKIFITLVDMGAEPPKLV